MNGDSKRKMARMKGIAKVIEFEKVQNNFSGSVWLSPNGHNVTARAYRAPPGHPDIDEAITYIHSVLREMLWDIV